MSTTPRKRLKHAVAATALSNPVYNRTRKVSFGSLLSNGWFSAAPDDVSVNRAIRTNNPGALNISRWQRSRPGYVGQTEPDSSGNKTTIYQTPEHGISAWYFLIYELYGFGRSGQFDLLSLAKKYAGGNASQSQIRAYTKGWTKWSKGRLKPDTVIHFGSKDEMLSFALAEFAHEAAAQSPIHDDQIVSALHV